MKLSKYIKAYHNKSERILKRYSKLLAILLAFFYTVIVLVVTLNRFWQFEVFYHDHGYYESAVYNVSRFKPPIVEHPSLGRIHIFADHVVPSMFLISPIYWFTDRYEATLVVQAIGVGSSVFVAYLIANKLIKNQFMVFALIFAYMFYIGMQNALIFFLHPTTLMIFPLMLLFWAIINNKIKLYYLLLIINLGFKETVIALTFALTVFLYLYDRRWKKHAIATGLITTIYALLVTKIIVPPLSPTGQFNYQPQWKEIFEGFITRWFRPTIKVETMAASFATFGFLPLFSMIFLPVILQDFLLRFVVGPQAGFRLDLGQYYNANLVVLLFFGAVLAVNKLQKMQIFIKTQLLWSISIVATVIVLHRFIYHGPFGLAYNLEFYRHTFRQGFMWDFINKIQGNGKFMLQNNIAVFFTHNDVYILKNCEWIKQVQPDVIAFDFRPGQNVNNWWPSSDHEMKSNVELLKQSPSYVIEYSQDYRYIFTRDKNKDFELECPKDASKS